MEDIADRLEHLEKKMDSIGEMIDWLCKNMQGLFLFIEQVSTNGGGIRGLMSAMKNAPKTTTTSVQNTEEKEVEISNG